MFTKVDIINLLETRTSEVKVDRIVEKIGWDKCVRVESNRYAGGIWILWSGNAISMKVITIHDQFVILEVEDYKHNQWLLIVAYAYP